MIFTVGNNNCGIDERNRFNTFQLSRRITPHTETVHVPTIRVKNLHTIVATVSYNDETLKMLLKFKNGKVLKERKKKV